MTTRPERQFVVSSRPRGFTLWEMLLALAILSAVAAVTWPTVVATMQDHQLKQTVQTAWTAATATRMRAIETSMTYQFRFQVGGRRWVSIPWEPQGDSGSADANELQVSQVPVDAGQLPEGMVFAPLAGESVVTEELSSDWFAGLADADELSAARWSTPLVFFVDGSASGNGFRVMDEKGRAIPLMLRGLTGSLLTGPVQPEDRS